MRFSSLAAAAGSACVVTVAACHKSSTVPVGGGTARVPPAPAAPPQPAPSATTLASAPPEPADGGRPADGGKPAPARPPRRTAKAGAAKAAPARAGATAPPKPSSAEPVAKARSAPPPPPPPKQSIVRGTYIGADLFNLSIQTVSPVQVGKTGLAAISLVAHAPFHCNNKYPYKFKLDAPGGAVSYPSDLVRGMSVNGAHAFMNVPFVGRQPGRTTISGTLYMSVCSAEQCVMDRRHLAVSVQIE